MTRRLFVFGTLKKGFKSHFRLKGARFAGEALTQEACYRMIAVKWLGEFFPGAVTGGDARIAGEVYEGLDDVLLAELDKFEEEGTDYIREEIGLQDGTKAWMYVFINRANLPFESEHPQIIFMEDSNALIWRKGEKP